MALLLEVGAIRVMCKHIQLKDNTWYYRRRAPEDVRVLHRDKVTKKPKPQLFFSLKTTDKAEAARKADAYTRRLDAIWMAHRQGTNGLADPTVSLAVLENAGLGPGDGQRYPNHEVISDFVDGLVGQREPGDPPIRPTPQDRLTLDLLNGALVPRTLGDANEQHFALGKGPKGKVAKQQFERAWKLLLEVAGDITLDNLRREHANAYVRQLAKSRVGAETIKRYLSHVRPVICPASALVGQIVVIE
jgi:hypothetical protein